jgi:hypothetical protein
MAGAPNGRTEEGLRMTAECRAGRVIGIAIVIQMVLSVVVNFALEAPLFHAPGFLSNAGAHPRQIGLAALLGLVTEALPVGIAITAFPLLRRRTPALALWFFALAVVGLAVAAAESTSVMSMVSLSQAYAAATAVEREQLQTVRVVVASARNWAHFMGRILDGVTIFVLYVMLYRFALVPRAVAGFGLVAAGLMVSAVAMPFFGRHVVFPMLAPLGLAQLILAVWLLTRGFSGEASTEGDRNRL